jgi:DNA-binding protein HU-beta
LPSAAQKPAKAGLLAGDYVDGIESRPLDIRRRDRRHPAEMPPNNARPPAVHRNDSPDKGRLMNKLDLIATVAEQTDLPRAKTAEVVDALFAAIEAALKKKEEVRLVGFGTFATADRKESTGRNPRTGEEMQIPASTSVRFKPGKGLRDAVN